MTPSLYCDPLPINRLMDCLAKPTQTKVQAYVEGFLTMLRRPYHVDAKGNIFSDPTPEVFKPWMVGHMDTVHREHVDDRPLNIVRSGGWLAAFWNGKSGTGQTEQTGCGGDDKVGVWACLEAALRESAGGPAVGLFFPVDEEIGCVGTRAALATDKEAFASATCFVQLDRKGGEDAIQYTNGNNIWTAEFRKMLEPLMERFEFKPANGTSTDIGVLSHALKKPAINVASGYHNPHTGREVVKEDEALNSLAFGFAIVEAAHERNKTVGPDFGDMEPPTVTKTITSYFPSYGGGGGYGHGDAYPRDPDMLSDDEWNSRYGRSCASTRMPVLPLFPKSKAPKVNKPRVLTDLTLDSLVPLVRKLVASKLRYPEEWVQVITSPKGVACYRDAEGELSWPDSGKFGATGFAKDHARRIAEGGSCLDGVRCFSVKALGADGELWTVTHRDEMLYLVHDEAELQGVAGKLAAAFKGCAVAPHFEAVEAPVLVATPLSPMHTPLSVSFTKVVNAPRWKGSTPAKPVYLSPRQYFNAQDSAIRLTRTTLLFAEAYISDDSKNNYAQCYSVIQADIVGKEMWSKAVATLSVSLSNELPRHLLDTASDVL